MIRREQIDRHLIPGWKTLLPSKPGNCLLQACLLSEDAAALAWQQFEAMVDDPKRFFEQDTNGLKGLLAFVEYRLQFSEIQTEPSFRTYARVALVREELRSKIYYQILATVTESLDSAGIRYLAIRGAAIAPTLYQSPFVRHSHAIDLYVQTDDAPGADRVLIDLGLRAIKGSPGHFEHASGLPILVHTKLFDLPYCREPSGLASKICRAQIDGLQLSVLTPTASLLYLCVTGAYAHTNGNLRWLVDAWHIATRATELNWSEFVNDARHTGLATFCGMVLRYLHDVLKAPIPHSVLSRLETEGAATDPNTDQRLLASLLSSQRSHRRVWDILAYSARLRAKFLWFAAFPPPTYMRWKYALTTSWQLPLWYVGRPIRLLQRLLSPRGTGMVTVR